MEHRPETDSPLKNGDDATRWVYLGPRWFQVLDDYVSNPDRVEAIDEYGREPLFTTQRGTRPDGTTLYKWVIRALHPCEYAECPLGRKPSDCEARTRDNVPARCPSSRSPHAIRQGAITNHLNEDTSPASSPASSWVP